MSRTAAVLMIVMLCMTAILCSCNDKTEKPPAVVASEDTEPACIDPMQIPVSINTLTETVSDVPVAYPIVSGSGNDEAINLRIKETVEFIISDNANAAPQLDYEVFYNKNGILSIVIKALTENGREQLFPINFNVKYGDEIKISDLFSAEDKSWHELIELYIRTQADLMATELHSDATVSENSRFYLTEEALYVVYEMYEISYYTSGTPIFRIPYNVLSRYADENGAIAVILNLQKEN